MASTIEMYSKSNPVGHNSLRGVRRSRFSFHFMTHRTRRVLTVQWVSVPVSPTEDGQISTNSFVAGRKKHEGYQRLLDDFTTHCWLNRIA